jgi:hypothetical protein
MGEKALGLHARHAEQLVPLPKNPVLHTHALSVVALQLTVVLALTSHTRHARHAGSDTMLNVSASQALQTAYRTSTSPEAPA